MFLPLQVRNPSVELWPSRLASICRSVRPQLRTPSECELRCQPPKMLPSRCGESQLSAIVISLVLTGRRSLSNDLTHDK